MSPETPSSASPFLQLSDIRRKLQSREMSDEILQSIDAEIASLQEKLFSLAYILLNFPTTDKYPSPQEIAEILCRHMGYSGFPPDLLFASAQNLSRPPDHEEALTWYGNASRVLTSENFQRMLAEEQPHRQRDEVLLRRNSRQALCYLMNAIHFAGDDVTKAEYIEYAREWAVRNLRRGKVGLARAIEKQAGLTLSYENCIQYAKDLLQTAESEWRQCHADVRVDSPELTDAMHKDAWEGQVVHAAETLLRAAVNANVPGAQEELTAFRCNWESAKNAKYIHFEPSLGLPEGSQGAQEAPPENQ